MGLSISELRIECDALRCTWYMETDDDMILERFWREDGGVVRSGKYYCAEHA